MPARRLYQHDSYLREFNATVTRVEERKVFLDETAFHPRPVGGLDADTGRLILPDGKELRVTDVIEENGDVAHIVEEAAETLRPGTPVRGVIDWDRRYRMMRLHTALHIIAAILYKKHGALVTGSHVSPTGARVDFSIEARDWKNAILDAVREANEIAARCIEVRIYWLPREEAMKIPGIVKLAEKTPPGEKLRIVEIPGVDIQADEGPHVRNTCEIGEIRAEKLESRGKRRKRLYFNALEPQKQ